MPRPVFHPLPVARVDRLCEDAVAVTFAVPEDLAGEYDFRAGQYLTLRQDVDGREERRSYSICAPVGAAPRIGVRRVEGGLFSTRIVDSLKPGDTLEVLTPQGNFTPGRVPGRHHCFIAAGSGITPVLSIAATVLTEPDTRVTLLYGNRRSDTVMFAEELADLKDRHPARLHLIHVLSREPSEVDLFSGRLDAERLAALFDRVVPAAEVDQWWLCGPFGLIQDANALLAERGVPPENVHRELFYVAEPPPEPKRPDDTLADGPTAAVTIQLDGRATTLALPFDAPILDAAQRVRADLPFACKGGVCGTCRAKVTAGRVAMRRNYALERDEVAAGFVLTCQGLPATDTVTIDYDA
ncbi:1,2-phenylacetyl-CoA epoxidase subunit PaaE [Actinokineospora iranica]|uniref:Ring-1,2-phenylacetyl-CoA epoxidase subunit PaaE n=1 Tax=Actinokineospora iranica TaxID=1271860 RepID=A0A1G6US82_9PSEU|nr:1,2-phenylacetyl-CoA epoxidase subunit PaaE [Actinokineospora iranica]SDD44238.1 ring-1,2-phenylacetyl-CoA epoxidase subunit PaaE [Actinokineospora iranica]